MHYDFKIGDNNYGRLSFNAYINQLINFDVSIEKVECIMNQNLENT